MRISLPNLRFQLLTGLFLALGFNAFAQSIPDSLHLKTDSLIHNKTEQFDSVRSEASSKIDSLNNLSKGITHLADTLNPNKYLPAGEAQLSKYNQKVNALKGKLTHRIDSLNKINQPSGEYTHLLDSINNAGPLKDVKQAEAQLVSLEKKATAPIQKVNGAINNVGGKVNEKINLINKQAGGASIPGVSLPGGQASLPGANLPGANIPGVNLPNANIPSTGLPGPATGIPSTDLNLPTGSLPNATNPLNTGSTALPTGQTGSVPGMPQSPTGQLTNNSALGNAQQQLGKVDGYSKDAKNISTGNLDQVKELPKAAEAKAANMADMKELTGDAKMLDQYKSVAQDQEAAKKMAMEQVKQQAIDHFAGKEKQLQAAMSQMSGLKKKYGSLGSLKDIPKHRPNPMHGKPFIERIIPSINWQLQVKNNVLIDFNPNFGYRLTGRFNVGAGWNERIGVHHYHFSHHDRIYGPRTFIDFKLNNTWSVRTEVETMNTMIPSLNSGNPYEGSRHWVWGWFLGIKKDYKFSKHIRGNVQTLYNFLDKVYKTNPYADRFNVRIGFEFPMKKKEKKKEEEKK